MSSRILSHRPDAVVFDCDGVLVDSEPISNRVFAQVLTEEGLPTSYEDSVRRYLGRNTAECAAEVRQILGRPLRTDVVAEYERRCAEAFREGLGPIPGVVHLLDALVSAGLPRCVASSGTPDEIALRLELTKLGSYFDDRVYSAVLVPRGKPAPDLFQYAADRLGADPARCVLIEDSPAGVRGGKAAGMAVIGLASLVEPHRLAEAGADLVLTRLTDAIPAIVDSPPG
ncbi:MAG TPA: HAD family phosphatase [Micromonosporaceae bacterium]|nr:HAD family phosphatase [Micromonosporaceae bacterium]